MTQILPLIRRSALAATLALIVVQPANAYRDELKSAKSYQEMGAYTQALSKLEQALRDPKLKGRKKNRAEADLRDIKLQLAVEQFALGRKLEQRGEQIGATNAYRLATQYAPDNREYSTRYQQLNAVFENTRQETKNILEHSRRTNEWAQGSTALRSLATTTKVAEAGFALGQLNQEAGAYYAQQSDIALQKKQYRAAFDHIVRAERFSESTEVRKQKLARSHLLQSSKAWEQGRHSTAYEEIQKGLSFEPANTELIAYLNRFRSQWMGILYNEATTAKSQGRLQQAQQKFTQLLRYEPNYLDVSSQLNELNQTLVADYYEQAETLMRRSNGESAGQALAYYMVAAEQQGNEYPDVYNKISAAKQQLRSNLEYRISLKVTNSSIEAGAAGIVRDNILNSFNTNLKNVKVLEREALDDILREQGLGQAFFDEATAVQVKKIKGIQAGIYVDVVKFSVSKSGMNSPEYGSIKYVSGSRYIPNPRYSQLRQQVANAQQSVIQAKQEANQAQAAQNKQLHQQQQAGGYDSASTLVAGFGSILGSIGASASYDSAQNNLDQLQRELSGEPSQLEEDIYANWRYKIMNLEMAGEVILSYKIVNFTTSEIGQSQTADAHRVLHDRYIPGDPGKGVKNDPDDLPSKNVFKKQLLDAAMESLISGLGAQLGSRSGNHYLIAKDAAQDGNSGAATEHYIRFLYSGADLSSQQAHEANNYLYEELGIQLLRKKR